MRLSSDYEDMLKILNTHKVKYLVIGAYAVIYYTQPRYTKDIDIWVESSAENAKKVYKALKEFGAPLVNMSADDFLSDTLIYQIGIEPVRIDFITSIKGVDFNTAWERRKKIKYNDVCMNIISYEDLIIAKEKSGRSQDKVDLEKLKAMHKKQT